MAATLAHELAHAVTHDAAASLPRDVREVIAESAAYIVRERFGLDRSLRSTHDVASWLDDPDAFKFGMAAVHDAASSLIDAIESAERGMKDQAHRSAVIIAAAPGEEPPPVPARVASAEAGRR